MDLPKCNSGCNSGTVTEPTNLELSHDEFGTVRETSRHAPTYVADPDHHDVPGGDLKAIIR